MDKIGALWLKKDKNGEPYFSGVIGGKQVLIFKNKNKQQSKHPDYQVFSPEDKTDLPPQEGNNSDIPF